MKIAMMGAGGVGGFFGGRLANAGYDVTFIARGNRLEVKWLSGGVVDLGRGARVPTPANRAVCDILAVHADGSR